MYACCCGHRRCRLVRIGGRDREWTKARVLFPFILRLVGLVQLVRDVRMEGQQLILCGPESESRLSP